jgi:hypothetical protein
MKQGTGQSSDSGRKQEPVSHAINPGGAAQLGVAVIKNPTPLDAGRGFTAPKPVAETIHHCGSQGKHS